ncbi:MAG: PIG-L family deacetylase [Myxococcales bacterium]
MSLAEQCRSDRYDEIYVSPHLDDAIYSCAGRITQQRRAGRSVLVVTLFGNGKNDPAATEGRFGDFALRREEDRAAMARVDADYVWYNEPDFVFRRPGPGDLLRIAFPFLRLPASQMQSRLLSALLALFEQRLKPGGRVMFPLAVGFHPDHRIAFDVGRAVHAHGRFQVSFYEDIPYTLAPVMRTLRLRYLGFAPTRTPLIQSAHEMNVALFRFFHVPWLTFLPTLLYTLLLLLAQRLLNAQDRLRGEPAPIPEAETRIDDVIDDKVAAMRLYPTQTELFLAMDDKLYEMLREPAGYFERRWIFPRFEPPSQRLLQLGVTPREPM